MTSKQLKLIAEAKVNTSYCFICLDTKATKLVTRGKESFNTCNECASLVKQANDRRNSIKTNLAYKDDRHIFTYTLGMNLLPVKITIGDLK